MFGRKKMDTTVAVEPPPPQAPEEPTPHKLAGAMEAEFMEQYIALADSIGFTPTASSLEKLKMVLSGEGIEVYNYTAVSKYLDSKHPCEERSDFGGWSWVPLRGDDMNKNFMGSNWQNRAIDNTRVYQEAVPLPVLMTVKKILDRVPEAVFFVSSQRRQRPHGDPFLMVAVPGSQGYVVERWDEPGFRG
jgi:hypothetical protein